MHRKQFIQTVSVGLAGLLCPSGVWAYAPEVVAEEYPELSKHTITRAERIQVKYHWPRLVGKNAIRDVHGQHHTSTLLRLHTQQGASGWGLCSLKDAAEANSLIGKKLSELIHPATGILPGVEARFDLPLYDLAGIVLKKPVYQLLGQKGSREVSVYSGMIYLDEIPSPQNPGGMETILTNCQWDYNYGYRQLKIKIGRSGKWYPHDEGLQKDIEVVTRVHELFRGKSVELLVDANNAYTVADAKAFLTGIKNIPLYWLEEPFDEEEAGIRELRQWMNENGFAKTFYADGEFKPKHEVLMKMAEEGQLNVILMDVYGYGFSKWVQLLPTLQKMKVYSSPHAWGDRLKTHYALHLAAGLGGIHTVEGVTCVSDQIDYGHYPIVNGKMHVSDKPGFGMSLHV